MMAILIRWTDRYGAATNSASAGQKPCAFPSTMVSHSAFDIGQFTAKVALRGDGKLAEGIRFG